MKALLCVLIAGIVLCGCRPIPLPPAGGPQGNVLEVVSFDPPVPAVLHVGDRINVEVRYRVQTVNEARIFVRPYTGDERTPGAAAHPSPIYTTGEGVMIGWFELTQPGAVDRVRVEMVNAANNEVIAAVDRDIEARWE